MPVHALSDAAPPSYLAVIDVPKSRYHVSMTLNLSRAAGRTRGRFFRLNASKTLQGVEVESDEEEDSTPAKMKGKKT